MLPEQIEVALYTALDNETDSRIAGQVKATLRTLLHAGAPSQPSRWLRVCGDVVLAAGPAQRTTGTGDGGPAVSAGTAGGAGSRQASPRTLLAMPAAKLGPQTPSCVGFPFTICEVLPFHTAISHETEGRVCWLVAGGMGTLRMRRRVVRAAQPPPPPPLHLPLRPPCRTSHRGRWTLPSGWQL